MKTWLLLTLDEAVRQYQGNLGYADEARRLYRYDSFVANHLKVSAGDRAIIRDGNSILGSAVIERIECTPGVKQRRRCPSCGKTKLKERAHIRPRYRCECGQVCDEPINTEDNCQLYVADFGDTYLDLDTDSQIGIKDVWAVAPRLNKQMAILELDTPEATALIEGATGRSPHPDDLPASTGPTHREGARVPVYVDRLERDDRARRACIRHYGYRCAACGAALHELYGELGRNVIHVHHLTPLGEQGGPRDTDPVRDLRPLCPNCHAMVHQKKPPLTPDELARILIQNGRARPR